MTVMQTEPHLNPIFALSVLLAGIIELVLILKFSSTKEKLCLAMSQRGSLNLKRVVNICHFYWDPPLSKLWIRSCVGEFTHSRILDFDRIYLQCRYPTLHLNGTCSFLTKTCLHVFVSFIWDNVSLMLKLIHKSKEK